MEKMVSFSNRKLPGIVALCIVFFTKTLASASPVPQDKRGGNLASAVSVPQGEHGGTLAPAVPVPHGEHGGTLASSVPQDNDHDYDLDDDFDDDLRSVASSDSGLEALTAPAINGVVNPLSTGIGRGVAGAAAGTQQAADLLGDAADTLFHTLGGIAGNAEDGASVAVANAAPGVQGTVYVQS